MDRLQIVDSTASTARNLLRDCTRLVTFAGPSEVAGSGSSAVDGALAAALSWSVSLGRTHAGEIDGLTDSLERLGATWAAVDARVGPDRARMTAR